MSTAPVLEKRGEQQLAAEFLSRIPGYVPSWRPGTRGADAALLAAAARCISTIGARRNLAPDKNLLAFLETAGIDLIPASSARAPMVFTMNPSGADEQLPRGSRVAAQPPPGSTDQIIFETETALGLAAARLSEIVSVHPGRDQYADHSAAFAGGLPFDIFASFIDTQHAIHIGHKTILNLAGNVTVKVSFGLAAGSSEHLDVTWEYWDGQVWRPFQSVLEQCDVEAQKDLDGTNGFTKSGSITLKAGCAETKPLALNGVETFWIRGRLLEPLPSDPTQVLPLVESVKIRTVATSPLLCVLGTTEPTDCAAIMSDPDLQQGFSIKTGLLPDKALTGTTAIDLTKSFYPFGQQPQPGSVFYFTSNELLSKPGAHAQIVMKIAKTPEAETNVDSSTPVSHEVVWEYWNGSDWVLLSIQSASSPAVDADFTHNATFTFDVPENLTPTVVNDVEALWMRARLVSGGYGFTATVSWTDSRSNSLNTFTYLLPLPPALSGFRLGYTWESPGEAPEAVLALNNFQYLDFSEQAKYPGRPFLPFSRMQDTTPALYLGFDRILPVDFIGLLFDVLEGSGTEDAPVLVWEYWDGGDWQRLAVEDETGNLSRPGMVHFVGPEDAAPLARFGTSRYWIRARLREDGPPMVQTFNGIFLNAVWASQRQTILQETVGQSSGLPNQVFQLRQFPVIAGETIEVRELSGALAPIEYPLLRDEVGEDRARTVTDRNGKTTEVWVRWQNQQHLFFSGPDDRHYVVSREDGRLVFGDGEHGKIPPSKAIVLASEYKAGGGTSGNVSARAIKQALVGIAGVQEVFNALPAEGGSDTEPADEVADRGPRSLRTRGRAITPRDYEVMAQEASPEVAWVRVFSASDADLGRRPGHVLLMILPETNVQRPWPSFGLRERVRGYLEQHALSALGERHSIHVSGPEYYPIDLAVTVVPLVASTAGTVEQSVREALEDFLHPLRGGPKGNGWELGRDVFLSDIAAVVEGVAGVDYAPEITLLHDNTPQGTRIAVPRNQLVVAGDIHVKVEL